MSKNSYSVQIENLHLGHPKVRAEDWRSPLVKRLLEKPSYKDGTCELKDSFRPPKATQPTEQTVLLCWKGMKADVEKVVNSYQEPVITEFATLGLACILTTKRAGLEIMEVTRRGEKADYWLGRLGRRRFLLEVSGQQTGSLDDLCSEKAAQLEENPFGKPGYVCVANYDDLSARLWFYDGDEDDDDEGEDDGN